jgi:hypothetical protein
VTFCNYFLRQDDPDDRYFFDFTTSTLHEFSQLLAVRLERADLAGWIHRYALL